jgi:hypothetical protein
MIVQFVSFETMATDNEFRAQWEDYNKMVTGQQEFILQRELDGKNSQRYLSQHMFDEDDIPFTFKKERRSAHSHEVEMRIKEAGGYSVIQQDGKHETMPNECKVFVFLSTAPDLNLYKELLSNQYLNIYEAYYESCTYACILEFFVDQDDVPQLLEQLKLHNRITEIGVYKDCNEKKKSKKPGTHNIKKLMI